MAETLGSLCDKLTITKLKQYHTKNKQRLEILLIQERQLKEEINIFLNDAVNGCIPFEKLVCSACKVFKRQGNKGIVISGNIGTVFSLLAETNCKLWHEQEKVYDFEHVPLSEKDKVIKKLALLNLERNQCIDEINKYFQKMITANTSVKKGACNAFNT